jgi:hypothetical protein
MANHLQEFEDQVEARENTIEVLEVRLWWVQVRSLHDGSRGQ